MPGKISEGFSRIIKQFVTLVHLMWNCLRPEHMNEEDVKLSTAGEEPLGQQKQDVGWIKLKW